MCLFLLFFVIGTRIVFQKMHFLTKDIKGKHMKKTLIAIAVCSLGPMQAFAHTGVRDNVLEGVSTYTGYTISHGCADNAGGEGSATITSVDGNTSQKDVIAQSAVFPTDLSKAIIGPLNSNNYFTNTLRSTELLATGPLGTGGVSSSYDVTTAGIIANSLTALNNNSGQIAKISFTKANWARITAAQLQSALTVNYVAPSVFPEAYIKRQLVTPSGGTQIALFKGYDSWGGSLPEGGGTYGISSFRVQAPVLDPDSCYKGIKIFTAVINYCSTETAKKDTNFDRYDVWAGFDTKGYPGIVAAATNKTLVNGSPITATKVFTQQNLLPNSGTATKNSDGTDPIYWSTITVNRVSPMPSSCTSANQVYLGIAPSSEDIDKYLPMAIATKSHPNNPGKKFDPRSDPKTY